MPDEQIVDVVVIGGGQSALATAYYLRRSGLSYRVLDDQKGPGGAWSHAWTSLSLFSPAQWSSLPGRVMPRGRADYPSRDEVIAYLAEYETRYEIPVERDVRIQAVRDDAGTLMLETSSGTCRARAIVSATGSWARPRLPVNPGQSKFGGAVLHSARYSGPTEFVRQRVVVVGGGNSGAQIVADLFEAATVTWATRRAPEFLPDEVDGRYLFEQATARYKALQEGREAPVQRSLGSIVMVASVRRARDLGALQRLPMFERFTRTGVAWTKERTMDADVVILATGFRPALEHLEPLGIVEPNGRVATRGTRSVRDPRVWLVGYGDWTGYASATLIGVGRSARATVDEITGALAGDRVHNPLALVTP